jgi:branched-chain amino acid transport system ATP-binding protein
MRDQTAEVLFIDDLHASYGPSKALHGISLTVGEGEVVTLLGRNGAGKTTTLRSIVGLMKSRRGSVRIRGRESVNLTPEKIARLGVGYCPEERGIFSGLTVAENLMLPPVLAPGGFSLNEIHEMFPRLLERATSQGTKLSGGEQQMLAIARILRTGATLLLFDEPTEGLAPVIVQQIGDIIAGLKARGLTILLVEQNFDFAARLADRHYVVEHGRVVDCLSREDAVSTPEKIHSYLSV